MTPWFANKKHPLLLSSQGFGLNKGLASSRVPREALKKDYCCGDKEEGHGAFVKDDGIVGDDVEDEGIVGDDVEDDDIVGDDVEDNDNFGDDVEL